MGGAVIVLVIVASVAGCGSGSSTTTGATTATASTPKQNVTAAVDDTVAAGGYAGDITIKKVDFYRNNTTVIAKTPEGGLQGPNCGDFDQGAGAIFEKVYNGTGWKGQTFIEYHGGLVEKATGKELPNEIAANYSMTPDEAKKINWSNSDQLSNIDWSTYRGYCHPAFNH